MRIRALLASRSGTAAAEMAMVTPLLIVLMFGAFELGYYFFNDHIVAKAVRDGARFASRQSFPSMPCDGNAANEDAIKNLVRFGNVAGAGEPRISTWTNQTMVTVALRCAPDTTYTGIYTGATATIPVVTVEADVPYPSLFQMVGFDAVGLRLHGRSQASVMGI